MDNPLDRERDYLKLNNNEPKGYIFTLESVGNYNSNDIFKKTIEICKGKLEILKNLIISKDINVKKSQVKFDAFDYRIENENDTLGNLITNYINKNDNIKYCGYYIPHPNEKIFVLRLSLNNNNNLENCNKVILDTIEILIEKIDNIYKNFESIQN